MQNIPDYIIKNIKTILDEYNSKIKFLMAEYEILFEFDIVYLIYYKIPNRKTFDDYEWRNSIKKDLERIKFETPNNTIPAVSRVVSVADKGAVDAFGKRMIAITFKMAIRISHPETFMNERN